MTDKLLGKLKKLANENPDFLAQAETLVAASQGKIASDAAKFADYIIMTKQKTPIPTKTVVQYLESRGLKFKHYQPKGDRFTQGKLIEVDATAHKDNTTIDAYKKYHGAKGTVQQTRTENSSLGEDVIVRLDNGTIVEFAGANKSRGTGLKTQQITEDTGGATYEVVYFRKDDSKPTDAAKELVDAYRNRAKPGETRVSYYYSGPIVSAGYTKDGKAYFSMKVSQRGGRFTTFSIEEGYPLYIGVLPSDRPSGWKAQYERLVAELSE